MIYAWFGLVLPAAIEIMMFSPMRGSPSLLLVLIRAGLHVGAQRLVPSAFLNSRAGRSIDRDGAVT